MKILLISSVLPQNTTGGELVLYRHLSQWSDLNLVIATEYSQNLLGENLVKIRANPFLYRLTTTRFGRLAHSISLCFNGLYDISQLRHQVEHDKPDLILTVAHGELCWLAQRISQTYHIPLVTFFHDWYPDLAHVYSWVKKILERRFKQLYQHSKLVFCVTEEMREALGKHPNAQVLFPIPEQVMNHKGLAEMPKKEAFTVVYAGNFSDIYAPMLQSLCLAVQEVSGFQLKLFGPLPDWSNLLIQQVKEQGIYQGFVSQERLNQELCQASALLLCMSFHIKHKKRMQTSFPSKLVNYCQFGKPIAIWGAEYCSAIRWANKFQVALVITSPIVQDVVQALKKLANDPEEQKRLGKKASEIAEEIFNANKIQRHFLCSIHKL